MNREFNADARLLVGRRHAYVASWPDFLSLAVVLDASSRRVVGWAIGERMTSDLVLAALNMALAQRRPCGVIRQPIHEH